MLYRGYLEFRVSQNQGYLCWVGGVPIIRFIVLLGATLASSVLTSYHVGQPHLSSVLFGDTMVPNIESDYILLLGYSVSYKEYNLTGFNHQKNATHFTCCVNRRLCWMF